MSMQIYNGGIFGGILKIIKESDERDGTSSLSQEDLEYMDYLETLPKNVPTLGEGGDYYPQMPMRRTNVEYSSKCRAEYCTATFAKRVLAVVPFSN